MTIKNIISATLSIIILFSPDLAAQKKEQDLRREITLYNPYKPSLADFKKKSYLPEIDDTVRVIPRFSYNVLSRPYSPEFSISTIKPAALLSDPLPKLYKGYVKLGLGNYATPMAELSISSHRSRQGAIGLYGRHLSSFGKLPLRFFPERVFAGFMDNEASIYGKKFLGNSILGLSVDYDQKTRYAYGFKTDEPAYIYKPDKKEIKTGYYDVGVKAVFSSANLDSADFSYDFSLSHDYFNYSKYRTFNHTAFSGEMAKSIEKLYAGAILDFDYYKMADSLHMKPRYIFHANPFIRRSTGQWNFNLGLRFVLARDIESSARPYFYPDIGFGFTIVPEYLGFFTKLDGRLENNDPLNMFSLNPFLRPDTLFRMKNTDHSIAISAGLKGNSGMGGSYVLSASFSHVNDLMLFANIAHPDTLGHIERGNYFVPRTDDAEILNIHGELSGNISERLKFLTSGNFYSYTLAFNSHPWGKPVWNGSFELKYNLRDKILAGAGLSLLGKRYFLVRQSSTGWATLSDEVIETPAHFNLSLSAEYRYTKILSFWVKVNNISTRRYYEWAFYPSQMFSLMAGFSYSL